MPLKPHEIESWALEIIDRVKAGQPIEDFRVELKACWIQPEKAARQIAGHANAARGTPILWLIGVDEKKGVAGVDSKDLADWYSKAKAQFNELVPTLTDINIPIDGKTVIALLFEADRIPFVVKNPAYGKSEGGPVSLEIPWREGTSIRSAGRSDLLRLLSPIASLPNIEVLECSLSSSRYLDMKKNEIMNLNLHLDLYVEPLDNSTIVIPFHRCSIEVEIQEWLSITQFPELSISPPTRTVLREMRSESASRTIDSTSDEIIIYGPGKAYLSSSMNFPIIDKPPKHEAFVTMNLLPSNAEIPVVINVTLPLTAEEKEDSYIWRYIQ